MSCCLPWTSSLPKEEAKPSQLTNQNRTSSKSFKEEQKFPDKNELIHKELDDIKWATQKELNDSKAEFEKLKQQINDEKAKYELSYNNAVQALGGSLQTDYPGILDKPQNYENDPSFVIRALAQKRKFVLGLTAKLEKVQARVEQAQQTLNYLNVDPSELLPKIEGLRKQINDKSDDVKKLQEEIGALTSTENGDQGGQTIEQLRAQMLKQLKDQQQEFDNQIDVVFSEHKNLQKQQQQDYDEQLHQLSALIDAQKEQHKNEVNTLRSALQKDDQNSKGGPKEDHTLEYAEKLRVYQNEQSQKAVKRQKELDDLRTLIQQLEDQFSQQRFEFEQQLQTVEEQNREHEHALAEAKNRRRSQSSVDVQQESRCLSCGSNDITLEGAAVCNNCNEPFAMS